MRDPKIWRENLERSAPFLDSDDTVRVMFRAYGRSLWHVLTDQAGSEHFKVRPDQLIAVSDSGITVLHTPPTYGRTKVAPTLVGRGPHVLPFGPTRGAWTRCRILDGDYWVTRYWYGDLREADDLLRRSDSPPTSA